MKPSDLSELKLHAAHMAGRLKVMSHPERLLMLCRMDEGEVSVNELVAITGLSQFYRSCLGVIAPELTRDLGLTPEDLGQANGAFFLAMGLMQVPVGLLFDRYGPRRTVTTLTALGSRTRLPR